MDSLIANRMVALENEKNEYKKRLEALNPSKTLSNIDDIFKINLSRGQLSKSDKVLIKSTSNGIEIVSKLKTEEHQYIFIIDNTEINLVKDFLFQQSNNRLEIKVLGFSEKTIDIECYLILIMKDNERRNIKVKPGDSEQFSIPDFELIENIKIAVRVKGNGYAYIHDPYLYGCNIGKINIISKPRKIKKIKELNVIFIGDEFTTRSFEPEFNLIKVTPENWEQELINEDPDLFLCESAWLGNNGAWQNKVGTGGPRNNSILLNLVDWCKENNISTVFWNKEDPFHYNAFVETAKHFDYVFTTDSNSIMKYKEDGCKNVFSFPFAAQPKYHNPIEKYERINKVVFAGAYYGDKFPERKKVMDNMIEISGEYGLSIFDRNYNNPDSPNQFPEEFKSYIAGTLKGDEIEKAYKGYRVSLNVNSIVDSPTMFSRRVFEIIASNTPIVSSESLGIKNLFGDLIVASNDFNILQERIDRYFKDEEFYRKNRLLGLRKVLIEHTYTHRVKDMLKDIGLDFINEEQVVTVIGLVRSKENYNELIEQYNRQAWQKKKLVILLDIFDGYLDIFNANNNEEVKTYLIDYLHHYNSLNDIIDTDYFAVFDKKHYYAENYLTDMTLSTSYVPDSIIVKGAAEEYTFTVKGQVSKSLIGKQSTGILNPLGLLEIICKTEQDSLDHWFKYGARFFNIDNFNFISNYKGKKNLTKKIKQITV